MSLLEAFIAMQEDNNFTKLFSPFAQEQESRCGLCGRLDGHYDFCSLSEKNSFLIKDKYLRQDDTYKLSKVSAWIGVDNPIIATCRNCDHTGLVDNPTLGLYRKY